MITVKHIGPYAYVYHDTTKAECLRYIGNGYIPPTLERELDRSIYQYARGISPPNYPVPSVIGIVWRYDNEIIIQDCDERCDPRRCYVVCDDGTLVTDTPDDGIESPNRR